MPSQSTCDHCGRPVKSHDNPLPTVDIVVIRDGKILLIERRNPPPGWALPGGFIECGESAETAAARELQEETGLRVVSLRLLGVYSEPHRDPRFHTLSVVYLADAEGDAVAGDDAGRAAWFDRASLPDVIAFDHRRIINDAYRAQTE